MRKESMGWREAACFIDAAYTGGNVERPGIQALKREIMAGRIKIVLVYKLERVLRSTDEWTPLRSLLKKYGCQLVSVTEDLEDETASGRLKTNMLVSFSEYQRLNDREKSMSKQREQAKRGYWRGGLDAYGYLNDPKEKKLQVDENEAKNVREVFERTAKLESLTTIADDMTVRGVRTRVSIFKNRNQQKVTVGDKAIRSDWLRRLIENPLYRGIVRHGGQEYAGQHEAIVTTEMWEAANAAIAEKKQPASIVSGRDKHHNLLKGLLVCGCCGSAMVPHASGKLDPSGRPYRYYACNHRIKERRASPCSMGQVAGPAIERSIVSVLAGMSRHPDIVAATLTTGKAEAVAQVAPLEKKLRASARELDQVAKELRNLTLAIAKDGLDALDDELRESAEILKATKSKLTVERERMQQELDSLKEEKLAPSKICAALQRFDELWQKMTVEERRELVKLMISRVEVKPTSKASGVGEESGFRQLRLQIKMHLPQLLERGSEVTVSVARKKTVTIDAAVQIPTGTGSISILEPFKQSLDVALNGARGKAKKVEGRMNFRAIFRRAAVLRRKQEQRPTLSIRSLARNQRISPATVCYYLSLYRLAPEIRDFLCARSAAATPAVSFRRLVALSRQDRNSQLNALESWKRPD